VPPSASCSLLRLYHCPLRRKMCGRCAGGRCDVPKNHQGLCFHSSATTTWATLCHRLRAQPQIPDARGPPHACWVFGGAAHDGDFAPPVRGPAGKSSGPLPGSTLPGLPLRVPPCQATPAEASPADHPRLIPPNPGRSRV
jgi:hypothetical protein